MCTKLIDAMMRTAAIIDQAFIYINTIFSTSVIFKTTLTNTAITSGNVLTNGGIRRTYVRVMAFVYVFTMISVNSKTRRTFAVMTSESVSANLLRTTKMCSFDAFVNIFTCIGSDIESISGLSADLSAGIGAVSINARLVVSAGMPFALVYIYAFE